MPRLRHIDGSDILLSYSTNVHPSESLDQQYHYLKTFVAELKRRLSPGLPFALSMRLGAKAVEELGNPGERAKLKEYLDGHGLVLHNFNGFPYGNFHGERVKESVYLPDWTDPRRLQYTTALMDLMAELSPEQDTGISTLFGKQKQPGDSPGTMRKMTAHLGEAVCHACALYERTGKTVCLALEPEPFLHAETTGEVVEFFRDVVPEIAAMLARRCSLGREQADVVVRRFLTVCFDACHLSVEFEELEKSLAALTGAGAAIGCMQITSALRATAPFDSRTVQALRRFDEPRYLHQTFARTAGKVTGKYLELGEFLSAVANKPPDEARSHFHVPVNESDVAGLQTTRDETAGALKYCASRRLTRHFVLETYTWDVLTSDPAVITNGLEQEYRWALARLAEAGFILK